MSDTKLDAFKDYWGSFGRKREVTSHLPWMTVEEFDAFGVIGALGVGNAILLTNAGKQLHGK